jgi:hypothetical protein
LAEVEEYSWKYSGSDAVLMRSFLSSFPGTRHRAEAREMLVGLDAKAAQDEVARKEAARIAEEALQAAAERRAEEARLARLRAEQDEAYDSLRRNPGFESEVAFARKFLQSPKLGEVREMILSEIDNKDVDAQNSPPAAVLRRIVRSARLGKLKATVTGFKDADYSAEVVDRLRDSMLNLGLSIEMVDDEAVIRVSGDDGFDKRYTYSKNTLFGGGVHPEYASATITVQFAGAKIPSWSARVSAKSPESIKYSTFTFGGSESAFDNGPSQHDVHSQTLPVFKEAVKRLFEYR